MTHGIWHAFSTESTTNPVPPDRNVGGVGSGARQFNDASGIALSGNRLFIADTDNRRVQVLSTVDGGYLFQWTTTDRDGNEVRPESITTRTARSTSPPARCFTATCS